MTVVCNTSPIINLAAIEKLFLLQKIFNTIIIPQSVFDEIVVRGKGLPGSKEVQESNWIIVQQVNNKALVTALSEILDEGEAEAIALAVETNADLLLIDERKGRKIASRFELNVLGLLGVITIAKERKLIPSVREVLDELKTIAGFRISGTLYQYILLSVEE